MKNKIKNDAPEIFLKLFNRFLSEVASKGLINKNDCKQIIDIITLYFDTSMLDKIYDGEDEDKFESLIFNSFNFL